MIIRVKHIVQGNPGSSSGSSDTSLFTSVERLETDPRLALIFKCATLAAGGAALANHLLPGGLLAAIGMVDEILRGFLPICLVG